MNNIIRYLNKRNGNNISRFSSVWHWKLLLPYTLCKSFPTQFISKLHQFTPVTLWLRVTARLIGARGWSLQYWWKLIIHHRFTAQPALALMCPRGAQTGSMVCSWTVPPERRPLCTSSAHYLISSFRNWPWSVARAEAGAFTQRDDGKCNSCYKHTHQIFWFQV